MRRKATGGKRRAARRDTTRRDATRRGRDKRRGIREQGIEKLVLVPFSEKARKEEERAMARRLALASGIMALILRQSRD